MLQELKELLLQINNGKTLTEEEKKYYLNQISSISPQNKDENELKKQIISLCK